MLKVTFLGTGGSLPTTNRNPSAIMVNRDGELLMFDCGEGAQQQMMRAKTGMMNLSSIFITHFHADHILGIPGLVQTMSFQGRTEPLTIYGPEWVEEFITFLTAMGYYKLKFEINAVRLKSGESIKRDGYSIVALKTEHNVPSIGYALVEDERPGRFDRDKAIELGVPVGPLFSKLHHGGSVEVDGRVISAEDVVGEPRPGRKIVYSGDTRPCLDVLKASDGADLLIHDSTLADNMIDWAKESMHSTAGEAAALAKKAGVKKLVLTHLSSRYSDDATPLLNDAKELFEDVILAEDLLVIEVPLSDD
ncbi:ribonuclease Z [Methanococcoides alaskense]|uniref:Ribonuclease Z n=1 Tax=Methanococcoides alaskense TaxID=325778 RepID=A0AA90TYH2_9EURY|nr:ribonuclease Z [Methanococcoides alaskense]MDA0524048.1 ribonuclease Z [Methanococcoides alaskense]MDR6222498.1 ribonuclease Z [Methanococcoides alaskense]